MVYIKNIDICPLTILKLPFIIHLELTAQILKNVSAYINTIFFKTAHEVFYKFGLKSISSAKKMRIKNLH